MHKNATSVMWLASFMLAAAACGGGGGGTNQGPNDGTNQGPNDGDASTSGQWKSVGPDVLAPMRAIWGTGPKDIWAVGGETILHWDGAAWSSDPSFEALPSSRVQLRGVWGTAAATSLAGTARSGRWRRA